MNERLQSALKKLRLSGLIQSLDVRLEEAAGHSLTHAEFLELILQDELATRGDRLIQRRVKAAGFRELKTLDQFDFSFNPSINKRQAYELATCRFLQQARDVLWLGPPGVGKSFLVQALGYQAIKSGHVVYYRSVFDVVRDLLQDEALEGEERILAKYLKPDLLIIDDMGMKQLPSGPLVEMKHRPEVEMVEVGTKLLPQRALAAHLLVNCSKQRTAELLHLIHQERQHHQHAKYDGQVLLPVSVVVLGTIFSGPLSPCCSNPLPHPPKWPLSRETN